MQSIEPQGSAAQGLNVLHTALLGGRDSSPQALNSDAAMLLPVFVLRFSPVVILFVEDVTQSSTGLQLPSEHVSCFNCGVLLPLAGNRSSFWGKGAVSPLLGN